jgi:putative ABC transport system substrate-binding protein
MNFSVSDPNSRKFIAAFRGRLEELRWSAGRMRIDERLADGNLERLRAYAAELLELKPDVILAAATPSVSALHRLTQTVPIVFVNAQNPIGDGFVKSFARPGGNITGFLSFEPAMGGKWLELLKELVPRVTRVGLLYNPRTHTGQYFQVMDAAAPSMALTLVHIPHKDRSDVERGVDDFGREPNGALLVLPDSSNITNRDVIIRLIARYRLPAVCPYRFFVSSGALASYGPDYTDLYRQAATYVDRILKGEKPADLPVQAPTKYELLINLQAAKTIGINIAPLLLARADEVIE